MYAISVSMEVDHSGVKPLLTLGEAGAGVKSGSVPFVPSRSCKIVNRTDDGLSEVVVRGKPFGV